MSSFSFTENPHRRYNVLTSEWVLVSPHRTQRPWQGKVEKVEEERKPDYDPQCYLCPGNSRAGVETNPQYTETFAFTNDFSSLLKDSEAEPYSEGLLQARGEQGFCRVICFSPNHALTVPEMEIVDIVKVVELWQREYLELGSLDYVNHVQIFENKGSIMGCSNPHPHGQIWAQSSIPRESEKKGIQQKAYYNKHKRSLLKDYLEQEIEAQIRIIYQNDAFVALVPFWAVWPYEAMVIPKRHLQNITQLEDNEKRDLAQILKVLTTKFDNVFEIPFPYSAGIHQSPTDGQEHSAWHFHMSFYPPLLRSATVKKFMVGYEMFGEAQRDITPEYNAERLRELPEVHYKKQMVS